MRYRHVCTGGGWERTTWFWELNNVARSIEQHCALSRRVPPPWLTRTQQRTLLISNEKYHWAQFIIGTFKKCKESVMGVITSVGVQFSVDKMIFLQRTNPLNRPVNDKESVFQVRTTWPDTESTQWVILNRIQKTPLDTPRHPYKPPLTTPRKHPYFSFTH